MVPIPKYSIDQALSIEIFKDSSNIEKATLTMKDTKEVVLDIK